MNDSTYANPTLINSNFEDAYFILEVTDQANYTATDTILISTFVCIDDSFCDNLNLQDVTLCNLQVENDTVYLATSLNSETEFTYSWQLLNDTLNYASSYLNDTSIAHPFLLNGTIPFDLELELTISDNFNTTCRDTLTAF